MELHNEAGNINKELQKLASEAKKCAMGWMQLYSRVGMGKSSKLVDAKESIVDTFARTSHAGRSQQVAAIIACAFRQHAGLGIHVRIGEERRRFA